ncbi:MAG: glycosyltransferase [Pseudomonadota bacterium]|nr:glycosyltransferase [Pseudomonadota bacterium]
MRYFITPELTSISGGNKYDKKILNYLKGVQPKTINISPRKSPLTILSFFKILKKMPSNSTLIIDGLIAVKTYCIINMLAKKHKVLLLIHHPVSFEHKKNGDIAIKLKERKIFSRAQSLITVSKTMKKVIQGMLNDKKKISVVPPGVDEVYFKRDLSITQGYNLVCVGSVIPRKNIESCIETLLYLDEKWTLSIIGKYHERDSYYKFLNDLVQRLELTKRVRFLGVIDDNSSLINIIKKSRVYICLSHYEGYGMANIEAACLGLPLVVSDLPVFRENLKGFCRAYVNTNNSQDIADAINQLTINEKSFDINYPLKWHQVGFRFKRVINEQ